MNLIHIGGSYCDFDNLSFITDTSQTDGEEKFRLYFPGNLPVMVSDTTEIAWLKAFIAANAREISASPPQTSKS